VFAGMRGVDQRLINMARDGGCERARHRAQGGSGVALAVLLYRAEGGAAACGERRYLSASFWCRPRVIGFSIERPGSSPTPTGVFAGIVVAVALVLLINAIVNALEGRALRWRPIDRDMQI